jgi:hypothetical protein
MEIPKEILEFVKENVRRRYRIDDKEIEKRFTLNAIKNKEFLKKIKKNLKDFENWSSFKEILKKTKKEIYYSLRQYKRNEAQRKILLNELEKVLEKEGMSSNAIEIHKKILCTHISSIERINFYQEFYQKIFEIIGKPRRILDISCGMNPFSLPFMKLNNFTYICTEVKEEECEFINAYFSIISKYINLEAKAIKLNLFDLESSEFQRDFIEKNRLTDFDVAFLLKLIPAMERLKKGISDYILNWLPSNTLIVSGSKKSMVKGEEIGKKEENLIKRILIKNKLKIISKIEFENEFVFIVKRHNSL